ncbi:uncharacterized protein L199_004591 [Kwoniella botswanensis]|uniref:uncharacterized protein n=1 Tax=Kwoniella botswanensis TaxID=1268659 RepID=UPI00315DD22D
MMDILTFFPSYLLSSRSLPTAQVPCLAELQKQAQLLASSIPPLPTYSSFSFSSQSPPMTKTKKEIDLPQQSKSRGLPIPFLKQDKSWYTHNHTQASYDHPLPRYTERPDGEKEYIDEIDIGHGYDHIHRLGKSASLPNSSNKLWKTWNGGFRPIHIQSTLPSESGNALRPMREYGMNGSKSYAESVCSLTQPSIYNLRENGTQNDTDKSMTWIEWITCRTCL